jgi:hypothetical protein
MSLATEMAAVAAGCLSRPNKMSVWSDELGKFICVEDPRAKVPSGSPTIDPAFKLVFLTAAGGTLLFLVICMTVTLLTDKQPPPLLERIITGLFDLVKIGFGAVVGLLGGQVLAGRGATPPKTRAKRPT